MYDNDNNRIYRLGEKDYMVIEPITFLESVTIQYFVCYFESPR